MRNPRPHHFLTHQDASHRTIIVSLWAGLASIESVIAGYWLISMPKGGGNVFLFGFSKSRWILILGLFGCLVVFGLITYCVWRKTKIGNWITNFLGYLFGKRLFYGVSLSISLLGLLIFSQIWHLANIVSDPYVQGYLVRLIPYFFLATVFCVQTLLLFPMLRYGSPSWEEFFSLKILRYWSLSFGIILSVCLFIGITGIGITPDKIGWDAPGVPILPYQVSMVWGMGVLFFIFTANSHKNNRSPKTWWTIDVLISLVIWVSAIVLWTREPLAPSFFNPEPRAPNFEYYPHSDAALHDTMAQSLLIGDGFLGVARKPLYVLFLALLHGIAGQNYLEVVFLQVVVIGLFPVLLYWLGSSIHHRVSGLMASVLVILREGNALKLAGIIGVSNSKMLMSDLPATVFVVLITYFLVLWVKNPSKFRLLPLGIGGSLGLLLLLRPQSTFLIPAIFLLILLMFIKRPFVGLGVLGLFSIGIAFTVMPWLFRSYHLIGKFTLNDPNQMAFLTQQYRLDPGMDILQRNPGESDAAFINRVNTHIKEFTRENPGIVFKFVTSHFFHNQVEMVQTLPMSFWTVQKGDSELFPFWRTHGEKLWEECCSVSTYVKQLGYWDPQREPIMGYQLLPMAVSLLVIALGFGSVWVRRELAGWIPLGISLVYILSTAVGRYSGWRLILPADWVIILIFAVGLGQIVIWFISYVTARRVPVVSNETEANIWRLTSTFPDGIPFKYSKALLLGLVLLVLGLTPIIVEIVVPERYHPKTEQELLTLASPMGIEFAEDFLREGDAIILQGRAMYPRFYKSGTGEPGSGWYAFSERDFSRVGFVLLSNSRKFNVIMPVTNSPSNFPNASDVIIIGCQAGEYIDASVVGFLSGETGPIIRSDLSDFSCPLSVP